MVRDAQVGVLRRKRMEGKTQEASGAAAGMSVRSARKWERGLYPSQRSKPHRWRTRADPFAEVFDTEVEPLLAADHNGVLEATTILAELNRRHAGRFTGGQLRTLQRRVRQWRALNGPEKEVYFPQEHPPGREAAYDFTHCEELGVTIEFPDHSLQIGRSGTRILSRRSPPELRSEKRYPIFCIISGIPLSPVNSDRN